MGDPYHLTSPGHLVQQEAHVVRPHSGPGGDRVGTEWMVGFGQHVKNSAAGGGKPLSANNPPWLGTNFPGR